MSPISSKTAASAAAPLGTSQQQDSYLVVFRVYGSSIHLWPYNQEQSPPKVAAYRITCNDKGPAEDAGCQVRVFVLPDSLLDEVEQCHFQDQTQPQGQLVTTKDMAIFMTAPAPATREASYSFDLSVAAPIPSSAAVDHTNTTSLHHHCQQQANFNKVGSVYLYLDTKFSSQGVQRMQIMCSQTRRPIGQMQVEYLIVRNPKAYGVSMADRYFESFSRLGKLDGGHRGAGSGCRADLPGSITENTVASFNYAHRHGADMCELDVMCTSDGVPVVYHNYTLDTSKPGSTQINELTLSELRNLKNLSIHDKNCNHDLKRQVEVLPHKNCQPFPTLQEVLENVDQTCTLNIELKWAQLLCNGKSEALQYREINDSVDRILRCIEQFGGDRRILLSTFSADIAVMLRLKQSAWPVLFLTTGDKGRFSDPTTKTVKDAIHFAQAFDLAGVNPNAAHLNGKLVRYAQDKRLLMYAWGKIESAEAVRELKSIGLNGVIYDRVDLIKPQQD